MPNAPSVEAITSHSVSPIDLNHSLYGNFIDVQYVFAKALDAAIMQAAITELLLQLPALAGRYDARRGAVITRGKPPALKIQNTKKDISGLMKIGAEPQNRAEYVPTPSRRDVLAGRAPLASFTLTQGKPNDGCIFGMAINHMVTDAAGYHKIAKRLSVLYSQINSGAAPTKTKSITALDTFAFGTQRTRRETLAALKDSGAPKPIPIKGVLGGFIKSMVIKTMEKIAKNTPVIIYFTPKDIARLKDTVRAESGEPWISTNTALSAHFTRLMAKLSYGAETKTAVQLGQLLDLRGRYFEDDQEAQTDFIGNAILIHIDKAEFPNGRQNTSRGALARYYKSRKTRTNAVDVKRRLDLLADCLRHGYTNPGLEIKNPIIALNNQSKLPVYDICFGGQNPQRIIPQDVGDNIMFFPAADGGIEVYIRDIVNPHRQQALLTGEWQSQIFDF